VFERIELPAEEPLHRADDAAVAAAIGNWARVEAQAAARRLAAVAELTARRCDQGERADWSCDDWDGAAAEVSAALGVSHGRASGQMHEAMALRTRLPQVAALFAAGRLSARVAAGIAWRTNLVVDAEVGKTIDAALADAAAGWYRLSQYKLDQAIDAVVDRHDPGAVRQTRVNARGRDVSVGGQNPESGTAAVWGRLMGTDATVLDRRLSMMAHQVCEDDPRNLGQRRADALGALGAGSTELACQCGGPACPVAGVDARAGAVVIHVLADSAAATASPDPQMSGDHHSVPDAEIEAAPAGTAVIAGGPAVPVGFLAQMIAAGAKVRPMGEIPTGAQAGYRATTALDEFIRMRDLTCRFPNCDVPAHSCDIDHRLPWPIGPTHPSNLRALCRKHHLLRTFQGGAHGWRDVQLPDGTLVWTSPTGHIYTTIPGSRLWFPSWDTTTPPVTDQPIPEHPDRGFAMPRRRRTRVDDRARRIRCQRALNDVRVSERNRPPPF
jgi:hypothetical protein